MIAANAKGVQELHRMVGEFGLDVVHAYMKHVQDNAEEAVRRVIEVLKDGEFSYEMDHGAVIKVKVTLDKQNPQRRDRLHRHQRYLQVANGISTRLRPWLMRQRCT